MTTVDPDFAEWLGSEEISAVAASAPIETAWGSIAIDTSISSPIAFKADALAEAARQLAFRPGPMVVEALRVPGLRVDLIGKVVTLRASNGGYESGVDVFVVEADETEGGNGTKITVLRRL